MLNRIAQMVCMMLWLHLVTIVLSKSQLSIHLYLDREGIGRGRGCAAFAGVPKSGRYVTMIFPPREIRKDGSLFGCHVRHPYFLRCSIEGTTQKIGLGKVAKKLIRKVMVGDDGIRSRSEVLDGFGLRNVTPI